MLKVLIQASYTTNGLRGLIREGGTSRRESVAATISELGGTLEGFFYAFGDHDVYLIANFSDIESVTAFTLTINASGSVNAKTVILTTPEELDQAVSKTVNYRAPGQ